MKRVFWGLFLCGITYCFITSYAFGFGKDIEIYSGDINIFDVDYGKDSGNIIVAFQKKDEDGIEVYRSQDHGYTWQKASVDIAAPKNLSRIRVCADSSGDAASVYHVDEDGYLYVSFTTWSTVQPVVVLAPIKISDTPIVETSFDVVDNPTENRRIVVWSTGTGTNSKQQMKYSNGLSWNSWVDWYWDGGGAREDLAYTPGSSDGYIHWVCSSLAYGSTEEITYFRFPSLGNLYDKKTRLTSNSVKDYDPRVAGVNDDNSTVWVVYNRDDGTHEIDLYYRYSLDGGATWQPNEYAVSKVTGVDEYIADIKFYKYYPNSWVDMVYIYDDPAGDPVRKAIWCYASASDPTNWRGKYTINDQDVQAWPEDTAPRIVYSPGAPASGGGVVFSYAGRHGLYFDAPWNHTLTVTINGSGKVVSTPAGLDCSSDNITNSTVCDASFANNTAVALNATPIDGESYTSYFIDWGGDCSGSSTSCALSMDDDKSVTANFGALGTPVFALPLPTSQESWTYPPVVDPVKQAYAKDCRPFAVGDLTTGKITLKVGLPPFANAVDIYLGLYFPTIDSNNVYLITAGNNIQPISAGFTPWKANVSSMDIDETLFSNVSMSALPSGTYYMCVMVTPAGTTDLSAYYLWITYFVVP